MNQEMMKRAIQWEQARADYCRRQGRGIEASDVHDAFMAGVAAAEPDCAAKPPLPAGFAYATSEDLATALGAPPDEAKAFHARLERLAGGKPELVKGRRDASATDTLKPENPIEG